MKMNFAFIFALTLITSLAQAQTTSDQQSVQKNKPLFIGQAAPSGVVPKFMSGINDAVMTPLIGMAHIVSNTMVAPVEAAAQYANEMIEYYKNGDGKKEIDAMTQAERNAMLAGYALGLAVSIAGISSIDMPGLLKALLVAGILTPTVGRLMTVDISSPQLPEPPAA
jgi:hypothetical protein